MGRSVCPTTQNQASCNVVTRHNDGVVTTSMPKMSSLTSQQALSGLWSYGPWPAAALGSVQLSGRDPVLPSSFAVGAAAQSSIAAAALAACELGVQRGLSRASVSVDMTHAAVECGGWFSLDGRTPEAWDAFSGLYRCADGWVRIHANFRHHRDGALRLLGLSPATATREDAAQAMLHWRAEDFEAVAAEHNLVVAACRSFEQWDRHPQGRAVAAQPLMHFERIGDAPPRPLTPLDDSALSLSGVRVLDLTRILAGPVCGRTLAAHGADVMLINSPNLPNIESIADTSRGKRSAHVDLLTDTGRATLAALVRGCHVFVQGYRPGGLAAAGFGPEQVAGMRPGVVHVSLSAYGTTGPWATRRGFDSLVQTAGGFNDAEALAAASAAPKPLPMQILDYATGHLMAFAAIAAMHRQSVEGGSWHVTLSLAQTAQWLRSLGRIDNGFAVAPPDRTPYLCRETSGFGELVAVSHAARVSRVVATSAANLQPSMPPGSHAPEW